MTRQIETIADEKATISLCMIVRDAEDSLGEALDSAKPFVDELVVVDTGSQDRTQEVAAGRGAKLYEFAWCDDFSAARNYSLAQATCDWIFWMDSDDVLPAESGAILRRVVAEHPRRDAAFWVAVEQESDTESGRPRITRHGHLKLFPRHPEIRFRYRVHEQVAPAILRLGLPFEVTKAVVRHDNADRSPEANARRNERNLRLLQLDVADHPEDGFVLLNLGMTYLNLPDGLLAAVDYVRRALPKFEKKTPVRLNGFLLLAEALRRLDDVSGELETCTAARQEFPDDGILLLRLGGICFRRGELAAAEDCYRTALAAKKAHMSVLHFSDMPARAAVRLGEVLIRRGRRKEAEQVWRDFLKNYADDARVRAMLARSSLAPSTETISWRST